MKVCTHSGLSLLTQVLGQFASIARLRMAPQTPFDSAGTNKPLVVVLLVVFVVFAKVKKIPYSALWLDTHIFSSHTLASHVPPDIYLDHGTLASHTFV